jgi:hypothetical protein
MLKNDNAAMTKAAKRDPQSLKIEIGSGMSRRYPAVFAAGTP